MICFIAICCLQWCAGPGKARSTVSDDFGNYLEPSQVPFYMHEHETAFNPKWEFPRERLQLGM